MAISPYSPYFKPALKTVPVMLASRPVSRRGVVRHNSYIGTAGGTSRRKRRSVSLKALIKRTEAAKHFSFDTNLTMTHNTLYTCVPTQGITQGTGNINRTGDQVYLCALKIKAYWQSAVTAGPYTYRIIVGYSGEEVTTVGASSSFVSGLGVSEVFLPGTTGQATPNGLINPKAFTVLYDETFDINSQIAATADVQSFIHTVPINQQFNYQSSASIQGKVRNLCILVSAVTASGATGVTPVGNMICACDLIFKD